VRFNATSSASAYWDSRRGSREHRIEDLILFKSTDEVRLFRMCTSYRRRVFTYLDLRLASGMMERSLQGPVDFVCLRLGTRP
jgi:hypothetical protein